MTSVDVKTDVKQKELKDLVTVIYTKKKKKKKIGMGSTFKT